jgi:hypothetical protein
MTLATIKRRILFATQVTITAVTAFVVFLAGIYVIGHLPAFYQAFFTNAQVIVGLAEIIIAITLLFSAAIEVLSFLLKGVKDTTITLTRKY